MLLAFALYLAFGALAGIIAGLLGLGGGIVIVPMLNYAFRLQNLPAEYIHIMAVATSFACILFTSIASTRAHHRQGGVDWSIWRNITPGILAGTLCGTCIASGIPASWLKGFFICFLICVATNMLVGAKPKPTRQMPGLLGTMGVGCVIGAISSFVGIGGGTLSVPFMTFCNVAFHSAIGTSAAIGFPIALAGTLGYVWHGWNMSGLPDYTLGYVYLPGCLGVVIASTITAGFGARLAHRLPVAKLKRCFAIFLFVIAADMLWGLLKG